MALEVAVALGEGELVELAGLPDELDPSEVLTPEALPAGAAFRHNGQRGRILGVDPSNPRRFIVETFDAVRVSVRRENLRPFEPPPVAEGGFHVAWPVGAEGAAHFAAQVTETLSREEYCVVQLSVSPELGKRALQEADSPLIKYGTLRKEFETAYFGQRHHCKAAFLDGLAEEKPTPTRAMDEYDLLLSTFTRLLVPLSPVALEFTAFSRTHAMVRLPFRDGGEESRLQSYEVGEEDIADGVVDEHIRFLKRRHVCLMLFAETEGGELTLVPKDEDREPIRLETAAGRLVAFRHDRMTYSYQPRSASDLVLQAWILSEPDRLQNLSLVTENPAFKDETLGLITGPNTPGGTQIDCLGVAVQFPGGGDANADAFWAVCSVATDTVVKTPLSRFDMDIYTLPPDEWHMGRSYTAHGGFMCADIYALDAEFFNVKEEEAGLLAPAQRCLLEKGYEALYRTGHRRATLKGKRIGLFCGHSGDDWANGTYTMGSEDRHRAGYGSRIWASISGRLSHTFGITGPQSVIDTACSSALVAYGVGHTMLRKVEAHQAKVGVGSRLDEALMMGANIIPGPGNYINLCGPHMLSTRGRCFTFDAAADGFCRGEGVGAFCVRSQALRTEDTTATMIGACLNQDGRSASMTAPNGPAQQECIRGSMREAGLRASQVTCAELHGTGTALGDPIEVGSLKNVMQDRYVPLLQSSAKTYIGHLEASAGTAGLIKCMLMCAACAGSPNCHLITLNPHLDITGYPTVIATELSDFGSNSGYSGVSSFGFGGANARADVFSRSRKGPHATGAVNLEKLDYITVTCPFDEGPMHYLDGRAVPLVSSVKYHRGPYHADAIRDEFATYDYNSTLYTGRYQLHPPDQDVDEAPSDPVYIMGTWDAFKEQHEMVAGDFDGTWTFYVALGETRCERFQLRVDKDPERAIFPVVPNGSMRTRVVGPTSDPDGRYWLLDARDDQVPAGTVYRIRLQWLDPAPVMRWERAADAEAASWRGSFRHTYTVAGSWTSGLCEPMQDVSAEGDPPGSAWQACIMVGMSGTESFRFVRDYDEAQTIYPSVPNGGGEAQACGPDELCNGKSWTFRGVPGETLTLTLQVLDAHVAVTASSPSRGAWTSHSVEGPCRHSYHIAGPFTGLRYAPMQPDDRVPGVFRFRGVVGASGQEYFSIAVDADPGLTYFPETPGASPGESIVRGPEPADEGKVFGIFALRPGAEFEVILDWHAADKRRVVDIRWITPRFDFESMKAVAYQYLGGAQLVAP